MTEAPPRQRRRVGETTTDAATTAVAVDLRQQLHQAISEGQSLEVIAFVVRTNPDTGALMERNEKVQLPLHHEMHALSNGYINPYEFPLPVVIRLLIEGQLPSSRARKKQRWMATTALRCGILL